MGCLRLVLAAVAAHWRGTATAMDNGASPLPYLGWSSWCACTTSLTVVVPLHALTCMP